MMHRCLRLLLVSGVVVSCAPSTKPIRKRTSHAKNPELRAVIKADTAVATAAS
jgi:hypothetical protein